MSDLDKALADILAIRSQIAAGTAFHGYGPATVAGTGGVALATALAQFLWLDDPSGNPLTFFVGWAAAALISAAMIWTEMLARTRRHHSGLADAMILRAIEQFLPAGIAGVLLAIVLWRFAPEELWMLPGLWAILFGLGIFASYRLLPRATFWVGVYYLVSGSCCLAWAQGDYRFSPLAMAIPFGVGQLMAAAILYWTLERTNVEK